MKNDVININDNERFILSEWGCLYSILNDYGIDVSNISGRIGQHIVDDFMELMAEMGYVEKIGGNDDKK